MKKRKTNNELSSQIQMGNWLNDYEWTYYCTLTTRYDLSVKSARRSMERFKSFLLQYYPQFSIFWAAEPFDVKEGHHLHALISLTIKDYVDFEHGKNMIIEAWQIISKLESGKADSYCKIYQYDKKEGGSHYLAKYITRKNADYDFHIPQVTSQL